MRCFELPDENAYVKHLKESQANENRQHPIEQWIQQFEQQYPRGEIALSALQGQALATLIPMLLCGEQSAVHIFNKESLRLSEGLANSQSTEHQTYDEEALTALASIESDERYHEQALQLILKNLPTPKSQHKTKRKAQLFYAQIAQNTGSLAQHFQMIAQLDRCVCLLMDAVSRSDLSDNFLKQLFELIKKDEAKHVGFAKKHSSILQQLENQELTTQTNFNVQKSLVALLQTQSDTFEHLNIDSQALFSRLLKTQPKHTQPLQNKPLKEMI